MKGSKFAEESPETTESSDCAYLNPLQSACAYLSLVLFILFFVLNFVTLHRIKYKIDKPSAIIIFFFLLIALLRVAHWNIYLVTPSKSGYEEIFAALDELAIITTRAILY
jgi:hypothetical protein